MHNQESALENEMHNLFLGFWDTSLISARWPNLMIVNKKKKRKKKKKENKKRREPAE